MSAAATTAGTAIAAALGLAALAGLLHRRRSGVLRESDPAAVDTTGLELSRTGPTVVHFTAAWCGPCAAVRRVVDQVCADLPRVTRTEVDLDANPVAAREFSVLSLPTTIIFDADGRQRYRSSGVPKAADLRAALGPLLA